MGGNKGLGLFALVPTYLRECKIGGTSAWTVCVSAGACLILVCVFMLVWIFVYVSGFVFLSIWLLGKGEEIKCFSFRQRFVPLLSCRKPNRDLEVEQLLTAPSMLHEYRCLVPQPEEYISCFIYLFY